MRGLILGWLLLISFLAGYFFQHRDPVAAQDDVIASPKFPLLEEAVNFVEQYYVKEQPEHRVLEYALIRAYLGQLGDPNTFFIEPAVAASESDALAGRYGGIGVELRRDENGDFVLYPFKDSPAVRAGIRDGDIILAINGQPLSLSSTMDEVQQALRGQIVEGAGVTLVVRNISETEEREYFIPFEEILVPSVTWRVLYEDARLGYINISRFTSRTPDEFVQAVSELRAAEIQALVLDLRGNPGGLLQESLRIAGEFFDGGVLLVERRIDGETQKTDEAGGVMLDLPMVVLVNQGTASASEIVAGDLQDRGRAILIGQQTYGKGSIQSIFQLSDSSSIHVTVALWYTPSGGELDGVGLTPDITMIPDENGRDVELGEAVRYLQQRLAE